MSTPPGVNWLMHKSTSEPHSASLGITTIHADGTDPNDSVAQSVTSHFDGSSYISVNTTQGMEFEAQMREMDMLLSEISSAHDGDGDWGLEDSIASASHHHHHTESGSLAPGPISPTVPSTTKTATATTTTTTTTTMGMVPPHTALSADGGYQNLWDPSTAFATAPTRASGQPPMSSAAAHTAGDAAGRGGVATTAVAAAHAASPPRSPVGIWGTGQDAEAERAWQLLQQLFPGSISLQEAQQGEAKKGSGYSPTERAPTGSGSGAVGAHAGAPPPPPPPPYPTHAPPLALLHPTNPTATTAGSGAAFTVPPALSSDARTSPPRLTQTHSGAISERGGGGAGATAGESNDVHLLTLRSLLQQYNTVFYAYPTPEELLCLRAQQRSGGGGDASVTTIPAEAHGEDPHHAASETASTTALSLGSTSGTFTVSACDDPQGTPSLSPSLLPSGTSSGTISPACLSLSQTTTTASEGTADTRRRSHTGTKIFLGGLRFEVVQMGRVAITWIFERACGVRLEQASILIHRKSKSGKHHGVSPTGCVSVYVPEENHMVETLLDMNQRIFCAQDGIYVAPSAEVMKALIASRQLLDVSAEGKVRGPAHPVVVELANSGSGQQRHTRAQQQQQQQQHQQQHSSPHGGADLTSSSSGGGGPVRRGRGAGGAGGGASSSVAATDGGSTSTASGTPISLSPAAQGGGSLGSQSTGFSSRSSLISTNFHSRTSSQNSTLGLVPLDHGHSDVNVHHPVATTPPYTPPSGQSTSSSMTAAVLYGNVTSLPPPPPPHRDATGASGTALPPPPPPPPPSYVDATTGTIASAGFANPITTNSNNNNNTPVMMPMPMAYGASQAMLHSAPSSDVGSFYPPASTVSSGGSLVSMTSSQASLQALFAAGAFPPPPPSISALPHLHSHPAHSTASRSTNSASHQSVAAIPGLLFHTFPGNERVAREEGQLRRGSASAHEKNDTAPSASSDGAKASDGSGGGGGAPVALFLGGLAVGATAAYTVWLLSRLGVTVHMSDVTMLPAATPSVIGPGATGPLQPSAVVNVASEKDAENVLQQSKRLLCVPRGCYMVPHPPSGSTRSTPQIPDRQDAPSPPPAPSPVNAHASGPASATAARATAQTPVAIQTLIESDTELAKLSVFTAARRQVMRVGGGSRAPLASAATVAVAAPTSPSPSPSTPSSSPAAALRTGGGLPPPPPAYGAIPASTTGGATPPSEPLFAGRGSSHVSGAGGAAAGSRPPPPPGYAASLRAGPALGTLPPPPPPQYFAATRGAAAAMASHATQPPPSFHGGYAASVPSASTGATAAAGAGPMFTSQLPPPPPPPREMGMGMLPPPPPPTAANMAMNAATGTVGAGGATAANGAVPQTLFLFGQSYQLAPGTSIQFIPVITTTNPTGAGAAAPPTPPHAGVLLPPPSPPQQTLHR